MLFYDRLFAKFFRSKKTFMDDENENDSLLEDETTIDESKETLLTADDRSSTAATDQLLSQQESEDIRDLVTGSPFDDDVFESNLSPTNLSSAEESKKPSEVKKRWIRFAQDTLESQKSEEEIELQYSQQPVVDSRGRPKRLNFRQRQKRNRVQSIFLADNEEHMVFKPLSAKTPTTPGSQFANLVNNLVAQKRTENTAPSPTLSTAGNSLKERREHFEWSIKATQEVVKEKTEELNKVDEVQREKVTLRDVTKRLTERLKVERAPKFASVVGEAMKIASSAPSSLDDDNEESQSENTKQRANSITSGSLSNPPKMRRRQRQSSSSSLFVHKVRDIAKKPLLSSVSDTVQLRLHACYYTGVFILV